MWLSIHAGIRVIQFLVKGVTGNQYNLQFLRYFFCALFQYQDCLPRYIDSHYDDQTAMKPQTRQSLLNFWDVFSKYITCSWKILSRSWCFSIDSSEYCLFSQSCWRTVMQPYYLQLIRSFSTHRLNVRMPEPRMSCCDYMKMWTQDSSPNNGRQGYGTYFHERYANTEYPKDLGSSQIVEKGTNRPEYRLIVLFYLTKVFNPRNWMSNC